MTSRRTAPIPPDWQRTRRRILHRDHWTCTGPGCGRPATDVDHIVPAMRGGTDTDDNLASLCRRCHQAKTSAEANSVTRPGRFTSPRRPAESHPGLTTPGG